MRPAVSRLLVAVVAAGTLAGGLTAVVVSGSPSADRQVVATATTTRPPAAARPSPSRRVAPRPARTRRPTPVRPLYPLPAAAVQPEPCPPPPHSFPPAPPLGPPAVAESRLPAPAPVRVHAAGLRAVSGKGMWITDWPGDRVDAAAVVATARAAGLRQVWVRTGGSHEGYYGGPLLSALLPRAHAAGLAVIAWDFPTLSDPLVDVHRAQAVLGLRVAGQSVDGFSPDIETNDEGTYPTVRRVALYLSLVRIAAGTRPVVATVPRPTAYRQATYPYAAEAPYVDVFAPMVYWSCNEPGALVQQSVAYLSQWRPVAPIGQSYDMGPEGGRQGLPSGPEIWRFLDSARRTGAIGASLYLWSQTGPVQWRALTGYPWS